MSKYIKLEDAIEAVTSIFRVSALFSGMNDNENVWREKAEKVLAKCNVVTGTAKQGIKYIEVSDDCISRKALLEQIYADSEGKEGGYGDEWEFIDTINNLPSIVPSEESDTE